MIKLKVLSLFLLILFFSCGEASKTSVKTLKEKQNNSSVVTYDYDGLAPLLQQNEKGKTYVVNFWATWCKPCVDELPVFEKLKADYKDKNVEVLLVSLDFPNQIETQLLPFIEKNKIQSKVVVLDDPNQNKWINAIDKTWSGALPATIIYNENKRAFFEQSFSEELLLKELHKFIN